jgi:hypothetical protein
VEQNNAEVLEKGKCYQQANNFIRSATSPAILYYMGLSIPTDAATHD